MVTRAPDLASIHRCQDAVHPDTGYAGIKISRCCCPDLRLGLGSGRRGEGAGGAWLWWRRHHEQIFLIFILPVIQMCHGYLQNQFLLAVRRESGIIGTTMADTLEQSIGATTSEASSLPSWLSVMDPSPPPVSKERKALLFVQFEMAFPRVLELMSSGYTLNRAVDEIPIDIDHGAFLRWINKNPGRKELYKEAKEIRTESWAGKLVEYAEGESTAEDVQRSKLKVDTLKWLMGADNRRAYGDVKQVELGGSISITAALAQASQRVIEGVVIDAIEDKTVEEDE